MDRRTGEVVLTQTLKCVRRTRNKNLNTGNLRKYRPRVSKGRVTIRRKKHPFRPKDMEACQGRESIVKGVQGRGAYFCLADLQKAPGIGGVQIRLYGRGFHVV